MHNNAEVLAALSDWLSPGEVAHFLKRVLRVPEAWQQLRRPGFLARLRSSRPRSALTPAELGKLALGESILTRATSVSLPDDLETKLDSLWQQALNASPPTGDLESVMLLAFGLVRQAQGPDGAEQLVGLALRAPLRWRSALACAWNQLPAPTETLSRLARSEKPEAIALAANSLLANSDPSEAASAWLVAQPHVSGDVLIQLQTMGERTLAQALGSSQSDKAKLTAIPQHKKDLNFLLAQASRLQAEQDLQGTRELLQQAWEKASDITAEVADHLANLARLENDPVLELQARQHALRSHASPLRRAALALALLNLNRPQDALTAIPKEPTMPEEHIAAGMAKQQLWQPNDALHHLRQASRAADSLAFRNGHWLVRLARAFEAAGQLQEAVEVAILRVEASPCDLQARLFLSEIKSVAGDHASAAQEAHIALALEPESIPARDRMARSLQAAGEPAAALPHWQTLSQHQPAAVLHLAECALAAGQTAIAKEASKNALLAGANPAKSRVLHARALAAEGDQQGARQELQLATQSEPNDPEAWIALAQCQMEASDSEAAGATLAAAVQSAPNQGSLRIALAEWLKGQGRLTEALQTIEKIAHLGDENPEWLVAYGELLHALGHDDKAHAVLRNAISRLPASWPARLILAEILEARGDITAAWDMVSQLPTDRSAQAHLLAGRLGVQAAELGNETSLASGFSHLKAAQQQGAEDGKLLYWLAKGHEIGKEPEKALEQYQACLRQLQPKEGHAYLQAVIGLANAAALLQQTELALSALVEAHEQFPDDVSLLIALSRVYLADGKTDEALHVARQAADLDPVGGETLRQLGRAAASNEEWDAAIHALERLAGSSPEQAGDWLEMAQAAQKAGNIDPTRSALARALSLGRTNPDVLQQASSILLELQENTAAQRLLKRATSLSPDDPALLRTLGATSERIKDLETARTAWSRLAKLEPQNDTALSRAAQASWDLHRRAEAIGIWEQALEKHPENAELHVKLGRALLSNAEHQQALDHLSAATKLLPDSAELHLEAGQAHLRYGSAEHALDNLHRAAQLAPDNPKAPIALAECLLAINQPHQARETLQRASQFDGNFPKAKALLAISSARSGDLKAAEEAFNAAFSKGEIYAAEEAQSIAKAAMHLGHWSKALAVLNPQNAPQDDAQMLLTMARTRLRVTDARWLFAEAAQAVTHAPSSDHDSKASAKALQEILKAAEKNGLPSEDIEGLRLRMLAASGQADEVSLRSLEEHGAADDTGEVFEGIAIAHLRAQRPHEAQRVLSPESGSRIGGAWTYLLRSLSLEAQGNHPMARRLLAHCSGDAFLGPLAAYLTARCFLAEGDTEEAISHLNQALAAWPDEPTWQFQLAELYRHQDDLDAALPHLHRACEILPNESSYRLALARTLRDLGQLNEAEGAYAVAVDAVPSQGEVWREAGELALAMGNFPKAASRLERATALSPSDAQCLIGLARSLAAIGNLRLAKQKADNARSLAPRNPEVLITFAEIQAREGKPNQALETYQQALDVAPDPVPVILARSQLLAETNQHDQAISELLQLTEKAPENDRIWNGLAQIHQAAGNHEAAVETAAAAVRLAPRNGTYRAFLGRACHAAGQLDRALDELTQAEAILPHSAQIPLELGRLFETRRDTNRALDSYQRAVALDPDCPEAHFRAGVILKDFKAYAQAGKFLKRAVELNPKDPDLMHQFAAVRALELVHGGIEQPAELS